MSPLCVHFIHGPCIPAAFSAQALPSSLALALAAKLCQAWHEAFSSACPLLLSTRGCPLEQHGCIVGPCAPLQSMRAKPSFAPLVKLEWGLSPHRNMGVDILGAKPSYIYIYIHIYIYHPHTYIYIYIYIVFFCKSPHRKPS